MPPTFGGSGLDRIEGVRRAGCFRCAGRGGSPVPSFLAHRLGGVVRRRLGKVAESRVLIALDEGRHGHAWKERHRFKLTQRLGVKGNVGPVETCADGLVTEHVGRHRRYRAGHLSRGPRTVSSWQLREDRRIEGDRVHLVALGYKPVLPCQDFEKLSFGNGKFGTGFIAFEPLQDLTRFDMIAVAGRDLGLEELSTGSVVEYRP